MIYEIIGKITVTIIILLVMSAMVTSLPVAFKAVMSCLPTKRKGD